MRLLLLAAALFLVHLAHTPESSAGARDITLGDARTLFPEAASLGAFDRTLDARVVLGADGEELGLVLRTSPASDAIVGYAGASDVLVALGPDGRLVGAQLLASDDTDAHVADVANAEAFWRGFLGWDPGGARGPDVDAVAGSTLTSLAIAEGVEARLAGRSRSLRFPDAVTLAEVRSAFPDRFSEAVRLDADRLVDAQGRGLARVLRTSPHAEGVRGYRGPTEALLVLSMDGARILGAAMRASYDTPEYVERVRDDAAFWDDVEAWSVERWRSISYDEAGLEGVSGATQTSWGVAEGVRLRLAARSAAGGDRRARVRTAALVAILLGGLALGLGPRRGSKRLRLAWQVVLVAGFGIALGDLLSLALVAGWSKSGVPWREAPALVLLVAAALIVPWATRRQVYCTHLCPHGAVQEWLARLRLPRIALKPRLRRGLRLVPWVTLAAAFALAILAPRFELARIEPFDAWTLGTAAAVSLGILLAGFAAAPFVPMAYCKFGCPTGALLELVRSHGATRGLGRRELVAALVIVIAAPFALFASGARGPGPEGPGRDPHTASGWAFGTTWRFTTRAAPPSAALVDAVASELARIERELSAWSPGSEVSAFNASGTTLAIEISDELADLLAHALALSAATDGAFDVTVGPLVDAWGAGPSGERPAPTEVELAALGERVGWEKLTLTRDGDRATLAKSHPDLAIDLGALLQGYAADRAGDLCARAGATEHLIEVGGELVARGTWRVAIEDPRATEFTLLAFDLTDQALATSGSYRHATHLVHAGTDAPDTAPWALVAVLGSTCLDADGWSTALAVSGDRAPALAEREAVDALFVDGRGALTRSVETSFR